MDSSPSPIRRAAFRLRLATLLVLALVELAILLAALVLLTGQEEQWPALGIDAGGLALGPAAAVLLLFGLLLGLALLKLVAMLRAVERGAVFPAAGLRGFARYLFLAMLVSVLGPPLVGLALGGADGRHGLALTLDGSDALLLLVSGLVFFVARLLDEARRLADDHSQIV